MSPLGFLVNRRRSAAGPWPDMPEEPLATRPIAVRWRYARWNFARQRNGGSLRSPHCYTARGLLKTRQVRTQRCSPGRPRSARRPMIPWLRRCWAGFWGVSPSLLGCQCRGPLATRRFAFCFPFPKEDRASALLNPQRQPPRSCPGVGELHPNWPQKPGNFKLRKKGRLVVVAAPGALFSGLPYDQGHQHCACVPLAIHTR